MHSPFSGGFMSLNTQLFFYFQISTTKCKSILVCVCVSVVASIPFCFPNNCECFSCVHSFASKCMCMWVARQFVEYTFRRLSHIRQHMTVQTPNTEHANNASHGCSFATLPIVYCDYMSSSILLSIDCAPRFWLKRSLWWQTGYIMIMRLETATISCTKTDSQRGIMFQSNRHQENMLQINRTNPIFFRVASNPRPHACGPGFFPLNHSTLRSHTLFNIRGHSLVVT